MGTVTWCCHIAVVLLVSILCSCRARLLDSIYWNSSNTRFTAGQGLVLFPQIGDKMDIVCPRVGGAASPSSGGPEGEEFYRVYLVTRGQMQRCAVDQTDAPLLSCDKPHRDVKFTFKFQEFSPNLWGLEFLKGRDYFITSTSTGTLQGLDNTNGGVCRTKSMKLVLRVGQSSSDPPSELQESPTRYPPKQPKVKVKESPTRTQDGESNDGREDASAPSDGSDGTDPGLFIGIISGGVLLVLVIIVLLVLLWRCHRRRCGAPDVQRSASMSLDTLAGPKRADSVTGSDPNGSDRSDVVFPLRASDSMFCRHYEPVNTSDYGPPVYIVQEIPTQSPTNIYYKV